jgi:hypothetical protein
MSLDPESVQQIWNALDQLLGKSGSAQAYKAAIDWISEVASEADKKAKADETGKEKADYLALLLTALRLWWRDVSVLAATGDYWQLQGPPPSEAQLKWAKTLTAQDLQKHQIALARISNSLFRPVRLELLFENYWFNVLKSGKY